MPVDGATPLLFLVISLSERALVLRFSTPSPAVEEEKQSRYTTSTGVQLNSIMANLHHHRNTSCLGMYTTTKDEGVVDECSSRVG